MGKKRVNEMTFVKNLVTLVVFMMVVGMNAYSSNADSFLEFGDINFDGNKSHWRFSVDLFNFDYISDIEFDGEYLNIEKDQEYDVPGAGITFGRDFAFGGGWGMNANLTYIHATLSEKEVGKISKNYDEDLVSFQNQVYINMAQFRADLYFTVETQYFLMRPLIGGGVAQGSLRQEINYNYDDQQEKYYLNDTQDMTISSGYIGAQFVSGGGLITELRYGVNNYSVGKRTQDGRVKNAEEGDESTSSISEDFEDVESYSYDFASISIGTFF